MLEPVRLARRFMAGETISLRILWPVWLKLHMPEFLFKNDPFCHIAALGPGHKKKRRVFTHRLIILA